MSFYEDMSEVQKDLEDVSAGTGKKFFKNPLYKTFVRDLMSK
jgi:hypothetical protein